MGILLFKSSAGSVKIVIAKLPAVTLFTNLNYHFGFTGYLEHMKEPFCLLKAILIISHPYWPPNGLSKQSNGKKQLKRTLKHTLWDIESQIVVHLAVQPVLGKLDLIKS